MLNVALFLSLKLLSDLHRRCMKGNVNIGNWVLNWVSHFGRSYTTVKFVLNFSSSNIYVYHVYINLFHHPPHKTTVVKITLRLFHQVHNLFFGGNVVFVLFRSSCVLVLAHAQAVYQAQKRRSTWTNWTKTCTPQTMRKNCWPIL